MYLQISDHFYYMSIKGGGPGDVHSYFNPFGSPLEAFSLYSRLISDFEARIIQELEKPELIAKRLLRQLPREKGFTFFYEFARPTQWTVYSLYDFYSILKSINIRSIQFHIEREDFRNWVHQVIGDEKLGKNIKKISRKNLSSKNLRKKILNIIRNRIKELEKLATIED